MTRHAATTPNADHLRNDPDASPAGGGARRPGTVAARVEIDSLTSLRGLAALLVVLHHFRFNYGPAIAPDLYTSFFAKSYLWVDFFFILSGFIIAHVYGADFVGRRDPFAFRRFAVRRVARIYPLHLFILGLFVLWELLVWAVSGRQAAFYAENAPALIPAHVLMLQAFVPHPAREDGLSWNEPAWTISAEFVAYLLFPLLATPAARWRGAVAAGLPLCLLGLLGLASFITKDGTFAYTAIGWGVARAVLGFTIGLLLYRVYAGWRASGGAPAFWRSDAALLVPVIAVAFWLHLGLNDAGAVALFVPLVLAASVNDGRVNRFLVRKPVLWLGTLSFAVYLSHTLVQQLWWFAYRKVFDERVLTPGEAWLSFAVTMLAVIVASWLCYVLVERPGRRRVRAWLEPLVAGPKPRPDGARDLRPRPSR